MRGHEQGILERVLIFDKQSSTKSLMKSFRASYFQMNPPRYFFSTAVIFIWSLLLRAKAWNDLVKLTMKPGSLLLANYLNPFVIILKISVSIKQAHPTPLLSTCTLFAPSFIRISICCLVKNYGLYVGM